MAKLPLLHRLGDQDVALKGRLVSLLYANPFLEPTSADLGLRLAVAPDLLESVLADLCCVGLLEAADGRYRFCPRGEDYDEARELAEAYRGDGQEVRQQVVEMEALARAREALAVTHREVSAILEMVPVGVVLLDRFGHTLKTNALARDYLGLGPDQTAAAPCEALGLPLEEVLEAELRTEVDLERPLSVVSRPFRVSGSETGAAVILQDVTYRKQVEARAEEMREEFFSMIRHELRRPLQAVERFLSGVGPAGGEPGAQALALARTSADHLGAMVDDMLFLARLERDPMAVSIATTVSLSALLAGSDLAYRDRAAAGGIRLTMQPPEVDTEIRADERRLQQVMGNLLDNALKFTPRGGEVTLTGGRCGDVAWVSVGDSGPGIPEPEREQVLGKFYQVRSDDGRIPGLGLGLAICRLVVEAHGGDIRIAGNEGGGALITVRLPVRQNGR